MHDMRKLSTRFKVCGRQKNTRFEKFEKYVEEIRQTTNTRIERLECKVDAEISDRFRVCQDILKKTSADTAQWRRRADRIDKDLVEHKSNTDTVHSDHAKRHDNLKEEVSKLQCVLRENTMAKDPFKHFRPGVLPLTPSTALKSPLGTSLNGFSTESASPTHSMLPEIASPQKMPPP
mmetsp:Transcript_151937/g.279520  ORF Transcript_151937/g.279520 Transcript_151937/m.279520 type:complete len:177 (-) Transcript_151937:146-676(-)